MRLTAVLRSMRGEEVVSLEKEILRREEAWNDIARLHVAAAPGEHSSQPFVVVWQWVMPDGWLCRARRLLVGGVCR